MAKRIRDKRVHIMLSREEARLIQERMAELECRNKRAFVRKMAMDGYAAHADLSQVRELVSLQRRCIINLNQIANHVEEHDVYQYEIAELQKSYAALWEPLSEVLKRLAVIVTL